MSMSKCEQGHYYDSKKNVLCPACGSSGVTAVKTKLKVPETVSIEKKDTKVDIKEKNTTVENNDEGKTVGLLNKKTGIDPVVGWLVCIEGKDKGSDYRLRSEKNFIGRSEKMDVRITDETVSRENHAIVSFNPKKNFFKLMPGESRGLVYLNDEDVDNASEINAYDIIELGQTKLMFIPLCCEKFQW